MGLNKKGDFKYSHIGSLILGLLIIAIGMYGMFNIYFTSEDIDWEVCRESLILRNSLPEKDLIVEVASTKSALPLKCKTQTVTIDYEDVERAEKEIGETVSSCWYMIGRGEYKVFPSGSLASGKDTPCMICARVHLDSEVREFYSENKISIKRSLNNPLEGYDTSIWDYLNPDRGAKAFTYFEGWNEEGFNITPITDISWTGFDPEDKEVFSLPEYLQLEKGDLFIAYAEPTREEFASKERVVDPYMILLQYDDFDKLGYVWATSAEVADYLFNPFATASKNDIKVCSSIETVPS